MTKRLKFDKSKHLGKSLTVKTNPQKKRKVLIQKMDTLIRDVVRERDDWTCQRCGSKRKTNQVSHFWSRRHISTRWDLDNLDILCGGCHRYWEPDKAGEYRDFKIKQLGQRKYDTLEMKYRTITKWPTIDLEILYEQMKREYKQKPTG